MKSAATSTVYEKYREKRREERHLFRRKKLEFVKAECEDMYGSRNAARKFFQKSKGVRLVDPWRVHFNAILAVCCGVRGRALASHTDVRGFEPQCGGRLSSLTC